MASIDEDALLDALLASARADGGKDGFPTLASHLIALADVVRDVVVTVEAEYPDPDEQAALADIVMVFTQRIADSLLHD